MTVVMELVVLLQVIYLRNFLILRLLGYLINQMVIFQIIIQIHVLKKI